MPTAYEFRLGTCDARGDSVSAVCSCPGHLLCLTHRREKVLKSSILQRDTIDTDYVIEETESGCSCGIGQFSDPVEVIEAEAELLIGTAFCLNHQGGWVRRMWHSWLSAVRAS